MGLFNIIFDTVGLCLFCDTADHGKGGKTMTSSSLYYSGYAALPQLHISSLHLQVFRPLRDPCSQRDDEKGHAMQPGFTTPTQVIIHCNKSLWYHKICGIAIACFIYQNIIQCSHGVL